MKIKVNTTSAKQYLFFKLNDDHFAIKADIVKEIVDYVEITKIPKSNECVKGVTNIRGDITPIVDPLVRFGQDGVKIGKRTSFIILNIFNEKKQTTAHIGIIVDLVNEVDNVDEKDILKTPEFGTKIDTIFIENMIRHEDIEDYVTVLDISSVIDIAELAKTKG